MVRFGQEKLFKCKPAGKHPRLDVPKLDPQYRNIPAEGTRMPSKTLVEPASTSPARHFPCFRLPVIPRFLLSSCSPRRAAFTGPIGDTFIRLYVPAGNSKCFRRPAVSLRKVYAELRVKLGYFGMGAQCQAPNLPCVAYVHEKSNSIN